MNERNSKNTPPPEVSSSADNFYLYLTGKISLPDNLVIEKDCKHNHGVNGKTVRRAVKNRLGRCIICERAGTVKRRTAMYRLENMCASKHNKALKVFDEQQHKCDLFLI